VKKKKRIRDGVPGESYSNVVATSDVTATAAADGASAMAAGSPPNQYSVDDQYETESDVMSEVDWLRQCFVFTTLTDFRHRHCFHYVVT